MEETAAFPQILHLQLEKTRRASGRGFEERGVDGLPGGFHWAHLFDEQGQTSLERRDSRRFWSDFDRWFWSKTDGSTVDKSSFLSIAVEVHHF